MVAAQAQPDLRLPSAFDEVPAVGLEQLEKKVGPSEQTQSEKSRWPVMKGER
jgi:hypothetical protein